MPVTNLERRLGLFSVVTISMSSMVGSGIFVLPGIAFATTGPSVYLAFLLSAICILPAALSKAELATAMPTSGGTYVYLERTFGPLAGTVTGLGLFLSILLKAAFALVGFKAYLSVLTSFDPMQISLMFLVGIIFLNIFGVGKVSKILTMVLAITLVSMTLLCIFAALKMDMSHFTPLFPYELKGFLSTTALVFVSYAGVTKVAAIAEEIKDPEKNLPRGIITSLILVTIVYSLISFVLAGTFHYSEISGDLKPIYKIAEYVGGPTVGALFAVIATLTMVNTANAGVLAGSRFPFAMARDNLLPTILGKLHHKYLTPILSIILSGVIVGFVLVTFEVDKIAKLASAFMILIYILENVSVVVLRESRTQWYKPGYKAPMYPLLQIFGIISGLALLFAMGKITILAIMAIGIPGIIIFLGYSKKRTTRKGVVGIRGKRTDLIEQDPPKENTGFFSIDIKSDAEVVVGLFGREKSAEMLVEMGLSMATHTHVEVASILEIPEQTDLHDVIEEPGHMRSLRRRIIAMANEKEESITFDPVVSHDVSRTVFEISQRLHCQWLIIEWGGRSGSGLTFHNPVGWLKSHLHCNLATFRDAGVRYIRKMMVFINNDKNDKLVLATADHLAKVFWADITLVRFVKETDSDEKKYYEQSFLKELASKQENQVHTKVIAGSDKLKSLIAETIEYDLLILGSSDHTLVNSVTGTFDDKLIAKASCSVLAVHESSFID